MRASDEKEDLGALKRDNQGIDCKKLGKGAKSDESSYITSDTEHIERVLLNKSIFTLRQLWFEMTAGKAIVAHDSTEDIGRKSSHIS